MNDIIVRIHTMRDTHYRKFGDPPTAMYMGRDDFYDLRANKKYIPYYGVPEGSTNRRHIYMGMLIYTVDEERHLVMI